MKKSEGTPRGGHHSYKGPGAEDAAPQRHSPRAKALPTKGLPWCAHHTKDLPATSRMSTPALTSLLLPSLCSTFSTESGHCRGRSCPWSGAHTRAAGRATGNDKKKKSPKIISRNKSAMEEMNLRQPGVGMPWRGHDGAVPLKEVR